MADDYLPKSYTVGSMYTPADATEVSQQLDEEEEINEDQEARLAAMEANIAVFPVEKMAVGWNTLHRMLPGGNGAMVSGRIQLEYFTAPETAERHNITKILGATPPSGAAPTVTRLGVYAVESNGDLNRIAQTANDPTMFSVAAFSAVTKAFTAPCPFILGHRYATATLIVTAGTICNLWGTSTLGGGLLDDAPALAKQVSGQADLPSFIANANATGLGSVYTYSRIWS